MASFKIRRRERGFTLIEVMVAMLIMGIISLLSWRALDSTTRAGDHLNRATEQTLALVHTFDQIERDVAWRTTIEVPPDLARAGASNSALSITPSISIQRGSQGASRIDIIRASTAPGHWQRVQWWRSGSTLYRSAGVAASAYPLPVAAASTPVAAMQEVAGFDVRGLQTGRGWVALPGSVDASKIVALEITITQGSPSQPIRYRRVLALD
ncbi:general secretion pathway protein J [Bordetella ansorpii]|uniref:General secretion pathway protein J n=1 Tax=Bordetella ansorpii TaxID=288768 RepID=A0A157QKS1_9BORD|nr:prepilin-type N-terminal cleavage/methylation domain-containing protein [Bordetella ansorpii]SAI46248.1 general secretion pathway protein J [Bordetella ansorpii]